jgi:hypothetical protein
MSITQADADKIVANIEEELKLKFIDRGNIDFDKAVEIYHYCDKRLKEYNVNTHPIQYAYWLHLTRKYKTTVEITQETIDKYSVLRKNIY